MPYYVPLGVRGLIMNVGTHLIGALGGMRYRSALRVRARRLSSIPRPHFRNDSPITGQQAAVVGRDVA